MVCSSMRSSAFRADRFRARRPKQQSSTACRKRADHIRGARRRQPLSSRENAPNERKSRRARRAAARGSVHALGGRRAKDASPGGSKIATARSNWNGSSSSRRDRHDPHAEIALARSFPDRDARGDAVAQRRADRRGEQFIRRSVARAQALVGEEQALAHQARRPRVEVQHLALLRRGARRPRRSVRARRRRRARGRRRAAARAAPASPVPRRPVRPERRRRGADQRILSWRASSRSAHRPCAKRRSRTLTGRNRA